MPFDGIGKSLNTMWNLWMNSTFCSTNFKLKDPKESTGFLVIPTNLIMSVLSYTKSFEMLLILINETDASVSIKNMDFPCDALVFIKTKSDKLLFM